MLKCHYSTVWSMKNVVVLTVDRAFALFLRPHPGGFDTQESPPPGICHSSPKNANARGSSRVCGGGGGGAGSKNPKTTLPIKAINYSYGKKIIRRCMEKYSLLTKLAKCTLNIALKLTFILTAFQTS